MRYADFDEPRGRTYGDLMERVEKAYPPREPKPKTDWGLTWVVTVSAVAGGAWTLLWHRILMGSW